MTKDFLDRWKKIASKYETKEEEKPQKEAPAKAPGGSDRTAEEELDAFLEGLGQKPTAPERDKGSEDQEVEDLLADFGLEMEEEKPAPPAKVAPPPPAPAKAESEAQQRVLETLKKVGLVGTRPGAAPPAPAPKAPPAPPPMEEEEEQDEEEEEDSLLLELEALLSDGEPSAPSKGADDAKKRSPGAFEEEDLIAELEVMLEGEDAGGPRPIEAEPAARYKPAAPPVEKRWEPPAPAVVPPPAKRPEPPVEAAPVELVPKTLAPAPPPPPVAPLPPPEPPRAVAERLAKPGGERAGRVNGGRVNGGRVNGGRVNGGRVNGGRVNGGRVNGGRVNGGRVNGGRVNGGRVNGGRVNGGRVNGGRVNGGRVNGGRVNGGRVNGGRGYLPATAAQARRARVTQMAIAGAVTVMLFASLVLLVPTGGPQGPDVDGNLDDWSGTGALFYTATTDVALIPSLDLRQYAIRGDGETRLWFTAQAGGDFFTRPAGATPARGDVLLVLIDVDGSPATGYSYHDLGADRVVEVAGWGGQLRSTASKEFGVRPAYDYGGFEPAGAVQVAASGDRIEGLVTGLSGLSQGTRAAFELRGPSATGAMTVDAPSGPATLGRSGIVVMARPVATGILQHNIQAPSALLSVTIENPSGAGVTVSEVSVRAAYAPQVPAPVIGASVWDDTNRNGAVETATDVRISAANVGLAGAGPSRFPLTLPVTIAPGGRANLLVAADLVSTQVPNGTSIRLSMASPTDVAAGNQTLVSMRSLPPEAGKHPGSYVGAPPLVVAIDGIPMDWANIAGVTDPASDVTSAPVDITEMKGNVSVTAVSFLVSFRGAPLAGALLPVGLPATVQLPGTGTGGGPTVNPPAPGSDFVFVMFDADDDAATGFASGGHGYDYAIRVDGKGGQPLPDGLALLEWETIPSPGWTAMPADPLVAFGGGSVELGATLPPLVVPARNVTATAYASSWDGARDDLDAPLVFGNELGTRGGPGLARPVSVPIGEPTLWPPSAQIPEFQEVIVPVAGAALVYFASRRNPKRSAKRNAD